MTQQLSQDPGRSKQMPGPVDYIKSLAIVVGLGVFLVVLTGRVDWWAGWAFLGTFILYSLLLFRWLANVDPDLLHERQQDSSEDNQPYERVIIPLMVMLEIALLAVAALDSGRFGWSSVPAWVRVVGWFLLAIVGLIIPWVFRTNTFASGIGRIQEQRNHQVVTSGPYQYVRHPMYAGVILCFIAIPLLLGSWWALIPGVLLSLLFVVRTAQEDQMLIDQLPGYAAYTVRVRWRLIPGIY